MLKREAFWQEIEDRLLVLDSIQLNAFVNQFVNQEIQAMKSLEVDSNTLQQQLESITQSKEHYLIFITNELELRHFAETVKEAPHFSFADVNGIKRSLSDYRGKMIYLDVWASWCMPCLAEAPALSQLQQEYAESNLIFMGISLDCVRSDWKNAIDEHDLKGIQLVTDSCWESPFLSQYLITSIPRFFLIDQEGQFIDVDAPRPSSDEIGPLLDKYLHR
jgi:thiol-disulfide isomerase/thioredoxin